MLLKRCLSLAAAAACLAFAMPLYGCGDSAKPKLASTATASTASTQAAFAALLNSATPLPGGGARGGGTVIDFGNVAISKAQFDVLLRSEASSARPQGQPPIVPVPPSYSSCVAKLATLAAGLGATGKKRPSSAQLKAVCARSYKTFSTNVLNEIISSEWVIQGAAELGIAISDEEVRRYAQPSLESQFHSVALLKAYVTEGNLTISDLLFTAKAQLLNQKIRQKIKASIPQMTGADVVSYYNSHISNFRVPEERDIGLIRTKHAGTAAKARQELAAGASFATVAAKLAPEQPAYAHEGLLLKVTPHLFQEHELNDPIFSAPPHVVQPAVRINRFPGHHRRFQENPNDINNIDGYYIFEVQAIRHAYTKVFSQIATKLQSELPELRNKEALVAYIKSWRARLRPRTSCSPGYVVRKCRQYVARKNEVPEDAYTLN